MIIKILEPNDNILDYIECTKELNNPGIALSTPEEIKYSLGERPLNILTFVMVLDDNRIVASATVIMEKKLRYGQLCCHIEDVGVHPEFRNKGYGKDIVDYCIKVAKSNNCYKIKLNCVDSLIKFYEKLGFELNGNHMFIKGDNR